MKNYSFRTLLVLLMTLPAVASAQVRGVVYDKSSGDPMVGVSIVVKENSSVGTMTDMDGKFTIKAKDGETLQFSYIGYNDLAMKATSKEEMRIYLVENAVEMDEVVVVGVAMKKSDLTSTSLPITLKMFLPPILTKLCKDGFPVCM
jgi:hypothetical protein